MDRLNFSLPEFTRIIWASNQASSVWQPRINAINEIWPFLERRAVLSGLRLGALQSIAPDRLIVFQTWCIDNKQEYIILTQEGVSSTYGNAAIPYDPKKDWTYRVYLGKKPKMFSELWTAKDNRRIAEFLGYPECCAGFFEQYWYQDGWRDLTFAMTNFQSGKFGGSPFCNILLRHIGVRSVFHLPCSFNCPETVKLGKKILDCADDFGYNKQAEWIYEMLNWPVQWSSLHGVAMIVTPCFKIITSTDALPTISLIDLEGTEYPEEGATGPFFPFINKQPIQLRSKDLWTDNGFVNRASMRAAHDLILKATEKIILEPGMVLDLGCGNGLLLEKIHEKYEFLEPIGVENNMERAKKARLRHANVYQADVMDTRTYLAGNYQLILISLNRLLDGAKPESLLRELKQHTFYLFVYSYDRWNDRLQLLLADYFTEMAIEKNDNSEVRIYKPKA